MMLSNNPARELNNAQDLARTVLRSDMSDNRSHDIPASNIDKNQWLISVIGVEFNRLSSLRLEFQSRIITDVIYESYT